MGMANIITMLEKEIEKNNVYVDGKGNTITIEKIEGIARKSYVQDLKAGNISFDVTYYEYINNIMEDYVPVEALLSIMKDALKYGVERIEPDCQELMSAPAENAEPVAN
jgi:hypothetical protein